MNEKRTSKEDLWEAAGFLTDETHPDLKWDPFSPNAPEAITAMVPPSEMEPWIAKSREHHVLDRIHRPLSAPDLSGHGVEPHAPPSAQEALLDPVPLTSPLKPSPSPRPMRPLSDVSFSEILEVSERPSSPSGRWPFLSPLRIALAIAMVTVAFFAGGLLRAWVNPTPGLLAPEAQAQLQATSTFHCPPLQRDKTLACIDASQGLHRLCHMGCRNNGSCQQACDERLHTCLATCRSRSNNDPRPESAKAGAAHARGSSAVNADSQPAVGGVHKVRRVPRRAARHRRVGKRGRRSRSAHQSPSIRSPKPPKTDPSPWR